MLIIIGIIVIVTAVLWLYGLWITSTEKKDLYK